MKFENDPFEVVFDAFTTLYPELDCVVQWCTDLEDEDGYSVCGATVFPDDGGKPIVIVSGEIPVENAVEVLAHELAHVAAGEAAQNGEKWERAFDEIHEEYMRRQKKKRVEAIKRNFEDKTILTGIEYEE